MSRTLIDLPPGGEATITNIGGGGAIRQRLLGDLAFDEPCSNDPSGCPACNADCMDEIYGGHTCD